MSIIKFINGKNRKMSQLQNLIDYITNPEKAPEKYFAHTGLCGRSTYRDMLTFKLLHGKMTGRQYVHFILSFDRGVPYEKAFQVGSEVLTFFNGKYQVFMAMHINTSNCHCHFVLNTVGFDGYKFRQSRGEMKMLKDFANIILEKYNLNPVGKIRRSGIEWLWEEENFDDLDPYYDDMLDEEDEEEVYRPIRYEDENEPQKKEKFQPIWYEEEAEKHLKFRPIWYSDGQ